MLTLDQAKALLTEYGYSSFSEYQKANFLPETGVLDTATERHLLQVRYCALPDLFTLDARQPLAKWPKNTITWGFQVSFQLQGFSREQLVEVFTWAFLQWTRHANLFTVFMPKIDRDTDIVISSGRIDGRGNTLAWSELPPTPQVNQKYDSAEPFAFSSNPLAGKIDLGATAAHEIGHAFGISHRNPQPRNSPPALLDPIYNPNIRTPQEWDIEQIQARYGKPQPSTPPVDPDTPLPPQNPAKSPFKPGLDYSLEAGYTCVAVPDYLIAPKKSQ